MFRRILAFLALGIALAPSARAQQKLVVTGTQQIQHFDTLQVGNDALLRARDLTPARVNRAGGVEMARNFHSSQVAGSPVTYNGVVVGRVNGAGTAMLTPAGLPVPSNWVASLSRPKAAPKPNTGENMAGGMMGGLKGEVADAAGRGGDLAITECSLFVNNQKISTGSVVRIPLATIKVRAEFKCTLLSGKRAVEVAAEGNTDGLPWRAERRSVNVGQSILCHLSWDWKPKRKGENRFRFAAVAPMTADSNRANNRVEIRAILVAGE